MHGTCRGCGAAAALQPLVPQELKVAGTLPCVKLLVQATSARHVGRESGRQNKGKLSSPWGICTVLLLKKKKKKKVEVLKMLPIPEDDHNPGDEWSPGAHPGARAPRLRVSTCPEPPWQEILLTGLTLFCRL